MIKIDVNDIVDREKLAPLQWVVFVLGFLVFFCDGLDTGIIGFIAPPLLDEWQISKAELAPVFGAALIGMSIGALISGIFADKFGRKKIMIISMLILSIFTIISAYSTNTAELIIYRFITGLGLGATMPNVSTIVSEYMPKKHRAFLTGLAGCGFLMGVSSGGFLSAYLLKIFSWSELLIIIGLIPALLTLVLIFTLPESTQFLIINNQKKKALLILEKIHGKKIDKELVLSIAEKELVEQNNPFKDIFSKYLFGSLMLWLCSFMSLLVFYLFTSWMPTILKTVGFDLQQLSLMSTLFPFGGVIGAMIMCRFMDRLNPTKVITSSYFSAFLLFILLSFTHTNISIFSILIFMIGGLLAGAQTALFPLATLFYPANCRGSGVSWMHGISRIGAILGSFLGSFIFTLKLDMSSIFLSLAIPTFIAFICLALKWYGELNIAKQKFKVV
ncbi:MFS transporter [Acinetobacter baumannii]|nr:MFS transporter [Acinetobacter baumannii]